jgi:hypothetical protein
VTLSAKSVHDQSAKAVEQRISSPRTEPHKTTGVAVERAGVDLPGDSLSDEDDEQDPRDGEFVAMSSVRRAGTARSNAREAGVLLAPNMNEQPYPVGERQFTEEKASQLLLVRTKPEPRNRFTVECPRSSCECPSE